jgi:hypothetical protein
MILSFTRRRRANCEMSRCSRQKDPVSKTLRAAVSYERLQHFLTGRSADQLERTRLQITHHQSFGTRSHDVCVDFSMNLSVVWLGRGLFIDEGFVLIPNTQFTFISLKDCHCVL